MQARGAYYDMVQRQMESTGKDGEDAGFASLEETSQRASSRGKPGWPG
jgi:hypothetical protein